MGVLLQWSFKSNGFAQLQKLQKNRSVLWHLDGHKWPQTVQRHQQNRRHCAALWAHSPSTPDIKVDLLPCAGQHLRPAVTGSNFTRKAASLSLLWLAALIPVECGHLCVHTSNYQKVLVLSLVGSQVPKHDFRKPNGAEATVGMVPSQNC